ncbi:hypothetical protein AX15_006778 [Amanita polypyramis BW_CC]|nr:hypothetical protein AX15_006778 [Amanita polypyramis BW_CC]
MLVQQQLVFLLYCLAFCFDFAISAPVHFRRQNGTNQAKTVTTVNVINTPNGPMTQICTITLTPTINSAGTPVVQEVKTCDLQPGALNGAPSATVPSTTGSSLSPVQSEAPASVVPPLSSTSSPSQPTFATLTSPGVRNSAAVTQTLTTAAPSLTGGAIEHSGSSTSMPTSVPTSGVPTTTHGSNSSSPSVSTSVKGVVTSSASAAAADQASQTPTQKFQIPGKTLSVLPIGLGVFAGILVIALIVVGLVTYERTKYRKAFRRRRLAEMGGNTGYGGMSQV